MFAQQLAGAISHARLPQELDQLARDIWRAHASGILSDDEAQAAAESVHAKKRTASPTLAGGFKSASSALPRARRQRSADKQASIERRRRLARTSPVPPELVDSFTQGEHAVIAVVAGEIQRAGACTWCLDRIAAVAGVCRTLARDAIRKARAVGLLYSMERRRRGQKSLTNIVRVLRRSWGAWLKRVGHRKTMSTTNRFISNGSSPAVERSGKESGEGIIASFGPHSPP